METKTKQKDYKALLTVKEFPQTLRGREKLSNWLRKTADTIDESSPEDYSKIVKFRLMK